MKKLAKMSYWGHAVEVNKDQKQRKHYKMIRVKINMRWNINALPENAFEARMYFTQVFERRPAVAMYCRPTLSHAVKSMLTIKEITRMQKQHLLEKLNDVITYAGKA